MNNESSAPIHADYRQIRDILLELGIPIHRSGFRQLCAAIHLYSRTPSMCITKELYPRLAQEFGQTSWCNAEHTIRNVIAAAWANRDPAVWEKYFPHYSSRPTNKQFISMIAERIHQ